jgi:hypothetical protein
MQEIALNLLRQAKIFDDSIIPLSTEAYYNADKKQKKKYDFA